MIGVPTVFLILSCHPVSHYCFIKDVLTMYAQNLLCCSSTMLFFSQGGFKKIRTIFSIAQKMWNVSCIFYVNSLLYNRPRRTDTTIAGFYWHLFKHGIRPRREECPGCLNNQSQFREMRMERHGEGLKVKLSNEENHKERTDCFLWNNLEKVLLWS